MFAMPVVRKPSGSTATLLGGGYHASGAAGRDRLPAPHLPRGLRVDPLEGAGKCKLPCWGLPPLACKSAQTSICAMRRPGELCERFNTLYLVHGGEIADEMPTYRGEGRCEL